MKVAMLCAAVVTVIMVAIVLKVRGAVHTVGGSSGWGQSIDYKTWVSGETFVVGDTLQFSYGLSHSVDQVSKSDYDSCSNGNPIQSYSGGTTTVNLTSAGPMYFICPTVGHCAGGMKLAITVQSSSTAPSTAPSSPPTTPSTAPSSPSTTTPSTAPSSPSTTTPSTAPSSPSTTTPTTPNTNSSPPPPTTAYNGVGTGSSLNPALAVVSFVVSRLVLGGINVLDGIIY